MEKHDEDMIANDHAESRPEWIKPEIKSFAPVKAAEGISYTTSDGLTNMTP